MFRIAAILYSIVATTMAGGGVIAVLSAGFTGALPIISAAVAGAVLAIPVSYLIAREMVG